MTVTLANLVARVRERIGDFTEEHEIGFDGMKTRVRLRRNVVDGSVYAYDADDVELTTFTMDLASGWMTWSPSYPGEPYTVTFQSNKFAESAVRLAINHALPHLFPEFYVHTVDDSLSTTTGELEYQIPAAAEYPIAVWLYKEDRWVEHLNWLPIELPSLGHGIHFHRDPGLCPMRLEYVGRASGQLADDTDELSDVGIPDAAEEAIILFAAYELMTGKLGADALAGKTAEQKLTQQARQAFVESFLLAKRMGAMPPWPMTMQVGYG